MLPTNLLLAGVITGVTDLLTFAIRTGAWADGMMETHQRAASLLVTFPIGLLCLYRLSQRVASSRRN